MKEKRIFVAINLPIKLKSELVGLFANWPDFPARWVKKDNIHLTLAFLGNISDEEIVQLCQAMKELGNNNSPFSIKLTEINYGGKKRDVPKLVWVKGEKSEELSQLKESLDKILANSIGFLLEGRDFFPHITLGRIRKWEWQRIEPEERPNIPEAVSFNFEVNSVEVMESKLKKGGAEYFILMSIPLQKL